MKNIETRPVARLVDLQAAEDRMPESEPTLKMLKLSTIISLQDRMAALFLNKMVDQTAEQGDRLINRLLMQCLPAFIQSLSGKIIYVTDFGERSDRHEEVAAEYIEVREGDLSHRVLNRGSIFVEMPDERVVISISHFHEGMGQIASILQTRSSRDSAEFRSRWRAYTRRHNYLKNRAIFADGELVNRSRKYSWDDIYLTTQVRQAIKTHVEAFLANIDQLHEMGLKGRRGVIFSGSPGTGKTLLGKVLADTLGVSFIWVLPRHVRGPSSFHSILQLARFQSPCVLFLEDLDLFAENRESENKAVLGELMNQLDGASDTNGIVTIATTNRLEVIEKALRNRPGRFDRVLSIGPMNVASRAKLLTKLLSNISLTEDDIAYLVEQTADCSGAQVEELANTICILTLEAANGQSTQEATNLHAARSILEVAVQQICVKKDAPSLGFRLEA